MEYRNRKLKAETREKVSLAMNLPESICMTRWRSLRVRFVKEYAKTQHASDSAADVPDTEWHLYSNLMFLGDQIKPRKTMTSLMQPLVDFSEELTENESSAPDPLSNVGTENEYFWNYPDSSVANVLSNQTVAGGEETLIDTPRSNTMARVVSLDNSNQTPAGGEETLVDTPRANTKARKRSNPNPQEFGDFLIKITNISEKRFCSKSTPDHHDGFF